MSGFPIALRVRLLLLAAIVALLVMVMV